MTRMLASVRSPEEAEIALLGGADIIDLAGTDDLKDDGRRAADADPSGLIRQTVQAVDRRRPVSASAGYLPARPDIVATKVRDIAATGVDYVCLGILHTGDAAARINELTGIAARVKLIAVFFADASPDLSLLPLLKRCGFAGAMIGTRDKAAGRLLDHFDIARLSEFVEDCHALGMIAGLAGSLEMPDIPRLLVLAPDLLGFREALCVPAPGTEALDLARVRTVRGLIPPEGIAASPREVDYRLLAPRGYVPTHEDVPIDLVFVEDLVLPVFIGAYARERDAPQNIRFDVKASVMRTGRAAEDMRDVFSYDLITDGIRMLIGSGHIPLVETLAERIAAMVLGHPRVTKVVVRVQKLETGSGRVGVEIERTRMPARATEQHQSDRNRPADKPARQNNERPPAYDRPESAPDRPVMPLLAEASSKT